MGDHLVQFYNDETYLVDEIWNFLIPCLRLGESAVVIATRKRLDCIARNFAPGRPDQSRFDTVIGEVLSHASKGGHRHVRAYREMVALLCADAKPDAAIHLEELWNAIGKHYPFSLPAAVRL